MRDPIADLKHELLAAAERQQPHTAAVGAGRRRLRVSFSRNRVLLTATTVAVVTAATLVFTAPWNNSAGFLGRAQAALTPPPGTILHAKWELTSTSTDPACTVTHGPNEIWIDQTAPHMYRVLLDGLRIDPGITDPRELACASGTPSELGGSFDTEETLRFVPPNTLNANGPRFLFPVDPVKDLRVAISAGRAHDEGKTELDGRTVERIRTDPPTGCPEPPGCPRKPIYTYVDPETFSLVQVECEDCGGIFMPGKPVVRLHMVTRYLAFDPLPRTDENLALTDIRAQHPHATESWGTPGVVLHVPDAKTVRAAKAAKSARVTFEVTATNDDGGGDFPVSCWPRSGSRFPLGETMVQCAAIGSRGSTATGGFTVTVKRRR